MNTQTETPRMAVTITGELPEATVKEYEAPKPLGSARTAST